MITGVHVIVDSTSPDADRACLRDVVNLPGGGALGVYEPRRARPEPMA